ncbi:hypothetical protein TGPRC2_286460 [Toxoplasma gondii TgCatPRC2]|uniref:Uncharacterized protein n=1 Tax=Toxoplasma gondii TgCatPRC2 TaxID=1130821 RepID=A0A151HHP3_TOXGO|nr:hypothetical protein TGPRC2_286460 [Toxoplasma gondii TgCatPRC2]
MAETIELHDDAAFAPTRPDMECALHECMGRWGNLKIMFELECLLQEMEKRIQEIQAEKAMEERWEIVRTHLSKLQNEITEVEQKRADVSLKTLQLDEKALEKEHQVKCAFRQLNLGLKEQALLRERLRSVRG